MRRENIYGFALGALVLFWGINSKAAEKLDFPISDIPKLVKFEKNKFSIFVDYENRKKLLVYMINDTDDPMVLPSQDGDVYLKQEAKVNGEWVRSQPHGYSWCGNSYMISTRIEPRHFVVQEIEFNGWVPNADQPQNFETEILPVRYRFYTEALFNIFSNQDKMPVSPGLIKLSEYDTMALESGSVEKLADVVTGKIKVNSIDHMSAEETALSGLARFPGHPVAQEALRKVIKDLYLKAPAGDFSEAFNAQSPLNLVAAIFGVDEAQAIYLQLIQDKNFPFRKIALQSLVDGLKEKQSETNKLLDSYLQAYDTPLYSAALYLRSGSWSKNEKRTELKKVYQDAEAPDEIRRYAKGLYYHWFQNASIRVRTQLSFKTSLVDVSIENISTDSIKLEYTHIYDVISSEVELDYKEELNYGLVSVPYRKDFAEVVKAERHELIRKTLDPGEMITFKDVNIWRYHQIPDPLPKEFVYRIISNLPQFGDVPAGVEVCGFFESDDALKRKILLGALAEQR